MRMTCYPERVTAPTAPLPFDEAMAQLGLGLVVRFGSRASSRARPESDLDLGVLRTNGARLSHLELGALRLALSDRFGLPADVVDLATADCVLRREVISNGHVLHARTREAWTDLVARTLIDLDDLGPMLDACIAGVMRVAKAEAP